MSDSPAFEGAHGFHRGLAAGLPAVVVLPAEGGVAQLDGGHDVQDTVDLPVAAAGEAVTDVVTGGGIDRSGSGPGREVRLGREAGDVTDLDQQAGRAGRADAVEVGERGAGGFQQVCELKRGFRLCRG